LLRLIRASLNGVLKPAGHWPAGAVSAGTIRAAIRTVEREAL
jgi:hypothetical protein